MAVGNKIFVLTRTSIIKKSIIASSLQKYAVHQCKLLLIISPTITQYSMYLNKLNLQYLNTLMTAAVLPSQSLISFFFGSYFLELIFFTPYIESADLH